MISARLGRAHECGKTGSGVDCGFPSGAQEFSGIGDMIAAEALPLIGAADGLCSERQQRAW